MGLIGCGRDDLDRGLAEGLDDVDGRPGGQRHVAAGGELELLAGHGQPHLAEPGLGTAETTTPSAPTRWWRVSVSAVGMSFSARESRTAAHASGTATASPTRTASRTLTASGQSVGQQRGRRGAAEADAPERAAIAGTENGPSASA